MDLDVKSMIRVQKEIYWASPQEPQFLWENSPFLRQNPFSACLTQASLTTRSKFPSFLLVPFSCQMAKKLPLAHLPTPFKPQHFEQWYTDGTYRLPNMNMQAGQIIHDRMDPSSAISSKGQLGGSMEYPLPPPRGSYDMV